ncbi:MAG: hypothetical protein A2509_08980 [Candidatus Edwardsbacteria bacterium RIFOXYD12_FULL_50_11]|uniref:V-type ATP synthase subunit F n=1 Tax=Candidatus Edwardsbacteria bacterium GWF2_54_11 TaxID=1817851 RepID=A0A1F5R1S1_9BACT|nr:V-type ATP synthase subunit F [Candidatus Edwardsbacteria bacterium]OGF04250.1 MAG: hypothetical protein A2502_02345 [Candidatus Edwardsbacteria bacterium RifOxyC12_full_54_24]OGF08418.1 MAG: hypothetical protein A2024_06855 [Candidatus Edwardsbacteria bacterium GWF2_54_11]OGF09094.1 MAG: hypothetical protein A2273_10800 [Candidatus Edwardsbacteria bacterium RifOxyA12_full_54_48]OGF12381.1 MAG: hypothetical protein A3K15_00795 [Candidatus Edwardsbacteria bacterium GWE2_54_12]OGF17514.1 MAG:
MERLAVITDPCTATGFRMAGIETHEVADIHQMRSKVLELMKSDSYGMIAVNEDLGGDLGDDINRLIKGRALPVILPFPVPQGGVVESGEAYLSKLVKQAIGFYVKLK